MKPMFPLMALGLMGALAAMAPGVEAEIPIPDFIKICKKNDPQVDQCVKRSVEELRSHLVKGIPEFHVPSLEPLIIPEIRVGESTGIRIRARNVKAFGCSDFKINRLRVDLERNDIEMAITLPKLFILGDYTVDGRVFLLPVRGAGQLSGNMTDCKGDVRLKGTVSKRDGVDYLKYDSLVVRIAVGRGSLHLDNLFGGQQTLGEIVNAAINSNFKAFFNELKPSVERALSQEFLSVANKIVTSVPYDKLFPSS
ncbi:protein takeout-like [Thrips palmi]|uniref:Protein takeout-like n=1 Tax=Thrips palmi TaxID=161013 RepID=A0A6P8YGG9_THRPL|nr:protein takeout-like [Thrips palmi]